uniref:Uncharacterized protein n=1 Tax=Marmota marmota marmota TaxID=9994 RepID=A0A8C5YU03_MARMA
MASSGHCSTPLLVCSALPAAGWHPIMEDYNVHSAASILASVKEQEARFERLTRALEQERRHVALQLEHAQQPGVGSSGVGSGHPLPMAWQQLVLQVTAH